MNFLAVFLFAAFAEIAGCFAFWAWLKLGKSLLWSLPGTACLVLFAFALTRIPLPYAGRTYAAYGGVYVFASLLWLGLIERTPPDRWDVVGALICVAGSAVIVFAPHSR